tara:strand:- start:999 stop:1499 length:501 start_codon:yes stop_codon:yes gene_type:complete
MYIIYKIQCGEDIYIGSTKNYNKRIQEHKYRSKDDKYKHLKLYEKMNNTEPIFSIIQTIEKDRLKHEQKYIDELKPTLNMNNAMKNKELTRHKNKLRMRGLVYTKEQVEEIKKKAKLYRIKNDAKIKAKDKIKITCECGSTFIRRCIIQHQRTKKHNNYINSISYS